MITCSILEPVYYDKKTNPARTHFLSAISQLHMPLHKMATTEDFKTLQRLICDNTYAIRQFLLYMSTRPRVHADVQINVWQKKGTHAQSKLLSRITRLELTRHALEKPSREYPLMRSSKAKYGVIWTNIESSQLQSIAITGSEVDFEELRQLVQSHSRSLRSLELRQMKALADDHTTLPNVFALSEV